MVGNSKRLPSSSDPSGRGQGGAITKLISNWSGTEAGSHTSRSPLKNEIRSINRIDELSVDLGKENYIFIPDYTNLIAAGMVIQRQLKELMSQSGLEVDSDTGMKHTAMSMRFVLSEGKANNLNLAKHADT